MNVPTRFQQVAINCKTEIRLPLFFRFAAGLVLSLALVLLVGCGRQQETAPEDPELEGSKGRSKLEVPLPEVKFEDITAKAGINFHHVNGAFGERLLPETLGSGVAFFDYDNDGLQDLIFINSCYWPGHENKEKPAPTLKVYRNKGNAQFEDVTKEIGLDVTLFGMGVTAGDFDNDGWIDLFVTAMGKNRLFRNVAGKDGKRRFEDVTEQAEGFTAKGPWLTSGDFLKRSDPIDFPSSATFLDYDNDGLLDLFVCNYVQWSPKYDLTQGFTLAGKGRAYGPPRAFKGTHCQLFHNLGKGKFAEVSKQAGIQVTGNLDEPVGKSLGVIACDVDGDGWQDIIVANDTVRNFLFHNQRDGTFKERGQEAGVAYADGTPRGAMGIDWGEYRPGKFGLAIGNFANEPDTLFRLDHPKKLYFSDVANIEGLAGPSRIMLVFGLFFFDYDLDGRLDFLSCNGHLEPDIHLVQPSQSYKQPAQLFWNTGGKRAFEPVTPKEAGDDLFQPQVGRGCAYADIDNDGDLDVVLTANDGLPRLLLNKGGTGNHWVRLVLKGDGQRCNTSAIGANVILTAGGKSQQRRVTSGRGYLSQSELGITFGLGKTETIEKVEIHWPGKDIPPQILTNMAVDRVHLVELKTKESSK